jgi:hypothetical protein
MVFMLPAIILSMGALALGLWAHWLGGRYGCPRWVRLLPWPIGLTWLAGTCATAYGFVLAFGAVSGESVSASDKAQMLAAGISESMNGTAFAAVGLALWALAMLALTYKFHWGARGPKTPGDPPYR